MSASVTAAVALGSGLGSLLRYTIGLWLGQPLLSQFPWATLTVNMLGSLLIGWITGVQLPAEHWFNSAVCRQFMVTGFCGGFTTFSVFSLETLALLEQGRWSLAGAHIAATLGLMMLAVIVGSALAGRYGSAR